MFAGVRCELNLRVYRKVNGKRRALAQSRIDLNSAAVRPDNAAYTGDQDPLLFFTFQSPLCRSFNSDFD